VSSLSSGRQPSPPRFGREMRCVGALADLAAEKLTKQPDIKLFDVNDRDAGVYTAKPALAAWTFRGSLLVNSVNSPTRLSTAIVPPCS
jgi:hypothetical protein